MDHVQRALYDIHTHPNHKHAKFTLGKLIKNSVTLSDGRVVTAKDMLIECLPEIPWAYFALAGLIHSSETCQIGEIAYTQKDLYLQCMLHHGLSEPALFHFLFLMGNEEIVQIEPMKGTKKEILMQCLHYFYSCPYHIYRSKLRALLAVHMDETEKVEMKTLPTDVSSSHVHVEDKKKRVDRIGLMLDVLQQNHTDCMQSQEEFTGLVTSWLKPNEKLIFDGARYVVCEF